MSTPTVLFYDPNGAPWGTKLRQTCALRGLRLRPVEAADLGRTVLSLAKGARPAGEVLVVSDVPEPMLVFCGLTDRQLDRMLGDLRAMGAPRTCLKAVLTPHNGAWTLRELYGELVKERFQLS